MSSSSFYRAFEERHRGPRQLIGKRLEVYLPFVSPLRRLYKPAAAIDLGCGRGEWLELLRRQGFEPQGVDFDEGMLQACRERDLPVVQGDAIAHLKALADESQCVVSGFHFAEHIAFDDLETVVVEALRVLKPGGLLILETPNPENLVVGTSSFYLDPTHVRPLPPLLLSFLPEHHGYRRVRILRLQEAAELAQRGDVGLFDVLAGVSPDYSIVAQKDASAKALERFDAAFAAPHGLELNVLASRHDATAAQRAAAFEQRLTTAETHAAGMTDALSRLAALQDRLIRAAANAGRDKARIELLEEQQKNFRQQSEAAEHRALAAESRAQQQQARIEELEAGLHHWQQRAQALEPLQERIGQSERQREEAEQRAVSAESNARRLQARIDELSDSNDELMQRQASAHEQWQEQLQQGERRREEAERKAVDAQALLQQQQARIDEIGANAHHWWLQAQAFETERNALRASWSWRVTSPLRWGAGFVMQGSNQSGIAAADRRQFADVAASAAQRPLAEAMRVVLRNPALAYRINQRLLRYPTLHRRLVSVAQRSAVVPGGASTSAAASRSSIDYDPVNLTPRARGIYNALKTAIEHRRKVEA